MAEKDKTGIGQMLNNALGFFFRKQAEKLQEFERECIEKDLRGDKDRFDGFKEGVHFGWGKPRCVQNDDESQK